MAADPPIADRLAGSHVLLTGVTGFIGEALLHRLLADVPGVRVSALVRPKGSASGTDRLRGLLGKQVFAEVVTDAGGVDRLLETRVGAVEGDMAAVPPLPADLDALVHCAGDVSFNPPVDEAFTTNVVGAQQLLRRLAEVSDPQRPVHYVHVSTAYVAGRRRGRVPEGPVDHDVDAAAELEWGLAQRRVVEQQSRSSTVLGHERARAEKEHGRAGLLAAARATEERRQQWVTDTLVELGAERARSLGWTDCYTFTKAMGERVVESWADRLPVSVVRPSIVESALTTPHPGWIEGFKMAEPLILAYGRGELPEFPAAPDGVADIVPVDHVVAATVAVLAHPPGTGTPGYFHVSSGARNPLTFRRLYDLVRAYFEENPFTGARGAAPLPEWRFPGGRSVERLLATSERAHRVATSVVDRAPRGDRTRDLARRLDRQGRRLEFLRRYHDLYREYAEADLRFADDHTQALYASLSPEDQQRFGFDTAVIDWPTYLQEIHCPAVTGPVREMDARRNRSGSSRGRRGLSALTPTDGTAGASPEEAAAPGRAGSGEGASPVRAAFFDMDGTLLSSNVVETFLWLRLQELSPVDAATEVGRIGARLPGLVRAERRDRTAFLRSMYREYQGAGLAELEAVVDEQLGDHVLARLAPAAVRRVREHRAAGDVCVLITGAIRPLTRPLAPLFDHVEAADLAVDAHGVCTGDLVASPLTGESRAAWMRDWAGRTGVDLSASYGYADSHSDLPLLEAVGHPVAVRPDVALHRHARRRHWDVVDWASPDAAGRPLNPAGGR